MDESDAASCTASQSARDETMRGKNNRPETDPDVSEDLNLCIVVLSSKSLTSGPASGRANILLCVEPVDNHEPVYAVKPVDGPESVDTMISVDFLNACTLREPSAALNACNGSPEICTSLRLLQEYLMDGFLTNTEPLHITEQKESAEQ